MPYVRTALLSLLLVLYLPLLRYVSLWVTTMYTLYNNCYVMRLYYIIPVLFLDLYIFMIIHLVRRSSRDTRKILLLCKLENVLFKSIEKLSCTSDRPPELSIRNLHRMHCCDLWRIFVLKWQRELTCNNEGIYPYILECSIVTFLFCLAPCLSNWTSFNVSKSLKKSAMLMYWRG